MADDVDEVIRRIDATGTTLTTIYVTHAHADHYFGLERLLERFPHARAVAAPVVAAEIAAGNDAARADWADMFSGTALDNTAIPEPLDGDTITVDGEVLRGDRGRPGRHPEQHRAAHPLDRRRRRRRRRSTTASTPSSPRPTLTAGTAGWRASPRSPSSSRASSSPATSAPSCPTTTSPRRSAPPAPTSATSSPRSRPPAAPGPRRADAAPLPRPRQPERADPVGRHGAQAPPGLTGPATVLDPVAALRRPRRPRRRAARSC